MARNQVTIASVLQELAAQYDRVVSDREVFDHVLRIRPSAAKNPYASIRNELRFGAPRLGWVWLGRGELMPLHAVLAGLRFRLIPDDAELQARVLVRGSLRPFIPYGRNELHLQDADGQPLSTTDTSFGVVSMLFGAVDQPALDITDWLERHQFQPGDSILVTILRAAPFTLRLEYEPASQFRAADVAAQDQAFLDALAERIGRGQQNLLFAEDAVLPVYARVEWRTAYPGQPWRTLVRSDRRLRLIDGDTLTDGSFRDPLDWLLGDTEELAAESDAQLLFDIQTLQQQLLVRRRADAERRIWDGKAPRASTTRVIFDMRAGTSETIYHGSINALLDHTADIEERITRGDYKDVAWSLADEFEDQDLDLDPLDGDEDFFEFDEDAFQDFINNNPALAAAAQQLMASLTPEEMARLQRAESIEEAQQVLARHLSELLRRDPSLFATFEVDPATLHSNGNGHVNGNGNGNGHGLDPLDALVLDDAWDEDADWEEEEGEGDEQDENREQLDQALERSNELIDAFYQAQIIAGKSDNIVTNRCRDLWIYADFLGNFYRRSLEAGDYATLDEFLFFFYPRKVIESSARAAREICTSLKQFYQYLKAEGQISDAAFAVMMWERRDQVGQVVALYDQLDSDSPQFERQFAHLFAPYTA